MPSFDTINYSNRPNKNVERKLIAEVLGGLDQTFNIPEYSYVGMGSMWFSDFILLHKHFNIRRMVSIEREEYADRAEFNKPYSCISVEAGDTSIVLPDLNFDSPNIVWLDYDTGLEGPVLSDIECLMQRCAPGSVVIITVNAHRGRIPGKDEDGNELNTLEGLTRLAGDLVSPTLQAKDVSRRELPNRIGEILFGCLKHTIRRAGRSDRFEPIFHYYYSDNAPMVTVGGMITDDNTAQKLKKCDLSGKLHHVTGERQFRIDVPVLTIREKLALDNLLPRQSPPTVEDAKHVLGFGLEQRKLDAYHDFYNLYPVFGEMPF